MWIIISIILAIISLMAIADCSEKNKRIKALAYENAYLVILLHSDDREDNSKELNDLLTRIKEGKIK